MHQRLLLGTQNFTGLSRLTICEHGINFFTEEMYVY